MKLGTVESLSVMVSKAPDQVKKDNLTKDMHPKLIYRYQYRVLFLPLRKDMLYLASLQ